MHDSIVLISDFSTSRERSQFDHEKEASFIILLYLELLVFNVFLFYQVHSLIEKSLLKSWDAHQSRLVDFVISV